jgi:lipopolysaccharide export system protein LptA
VKTALILGLACVLATVAGEARAQVGRPSRPGVPTGRAMPPTRRDSLRAPGDTTTIKVDSTALPTFAPPDSVIRRLMAKPGYDVSRYQGDIITFDALTRAMKLTQNALVERDSQLVKSDTITYNGSGSSIRVGTDPSKRNNVFVTPGQAPILSSGAATYDLTNRRASLAGFKTQIPQSGEVLTITGERATVLMTAKDSATGTGGADIYFRNGTVTACDDSIPDYYFKAKEIKRTGSFVVARPAVLYIGDVPVLWLPFIFQDVRNGRRSGLIAPNIGVSDIVRNSKSYRRNVEGLGYYFAINDYLDSQVSVDWRSSAGDAGLVLGDGGFARYNGEFRYRWLERYVTGNLALSETKTGTANNTALTWGHQQNFTRNSSLSLNLNLVKNTSLQQQLTTNPNSSLATIASQANYQQKFGPMQMSLGASQKQYPGRTQLDRNFPTLSLTTSPLNLGSWLTWTPNLSYSATQQLGIDQPSALGLLLRAGKTTAGRDTIFGDTLRRSSRTSQLTFDTPLTVFGYNIGNQISVNSALNDFAERDIITDVVTGVQTDRIYAQTYHTEINYTPSFTLPALARNNFNLTQSLSLANVDGGPLCVRNERTGGQFVCQSKRPTFGLSAAPTLFHIFDQIPFGPFRAIRHSIAPTLSYSYAPARSVSNAYLAARAITKYSTTTGDTTGYLGALAQNALSFGLSTNIEGKVRTFSDSNPEGGEKLKLLSLNFTSLAYDFERARYTHSPIRGLTTQNFGYTVRSDLLPGVDVGVDYSLFAGSTLSDSAVFKPYRERVTGSFSFSNSANPFAVFARLFGKAVPPTDAGTDRLQPTPDNRYAAQVAAQPVAGRSARNAMQLPPSTAGWQASFTFTSARQRPVTGSNVVQYDPSLACSLLNTAVTRLQYDACVASARSNPNPPLPIGSGLSGSTIYVTPPTTSLGSSLGFNLTEHWAASWQTQYDFEAHNFASQIVSLQRDLHDWRAIFAFTQSPNGSFAFSFNVSLKAEPELKFDYHKATYRNEGLGR